MSGEQEVHSRRSASRAPTQYGPLIYLSARGCIAAGGGSHTGPGPGERRGSKGQVDPNPALSAALRSTPPILGCIRAANGIGESVPEKDLFAALPAINFEPVVADGG